MMLTNRLFILSADSKAEGAQDGIANYLDQHEGRDVVECC
jgi:hypothetical protein